MFPSETREVGARLPRQFDITLHEWITRARLNYGNHTYTHTRYSLDTPVLDWINANILQMYSRSRKLYQNLIRRFKLNVNIQELYIILIYVK